MSLTANQKRLLESAKKAAQELGERGKELTALIGALTACERLNLRWQPGAGYDAISKGKRFQITARKSQTTEGVNPSGRVGKFGRKAGYNFDVGILVELDEHFELAQIRRMNRDTIAELEAQEPGGRGLHVGKFRKHAKPVR